MRKSTRNRKKKFFERWSIPLFSLFIVAILGAILAPRFFSHIPVKQTPVRGDVHVAIPKPPVKMKTPTKAPAKISPRVAIIIDDIGQKTAPVRKLLELDMPLTFAILPGLPHSLDSARMIGSAGYEVMLHLPMEPENRRRNNPGKIALMVSQSESELRSAVKKMIAATPNVAGINNHMGSLFTKDVKKMRIVLEETKKAGLFFVDSYTTPKSVALETARAMGVKSAGRKVFLDNQRDSEKIKAALRRVIKIAERDGHVVAIGHPYPETIEAIAEMKAEMSVVGVELVFASDVVR